MTSKNQVTVPASIAKELGFHAGSQLLADSVNGTLVLRDAKGSLDELYGMLKVPKKLKNVSIKKAIEKGKRRYFNHPE